MTDSNDTDPRDASTTEDEPKHPLQRAHKFFLKAAPAIREINETIERHGGIDQVRDKVVERAGEVLKQVDEVVANATAIEGEVIEREAPAPAAGTAAGGAAGTRSSTRTTPLAQPVEPHRSPARWIALGVVTAAATYGALRVQRRN